MDQVYENKQRIVIHVQTNGAATKRLKIKTEQTKENFKIILSLRKLCIRIHFVINSSLFIVVQVPHTLYLS